MMTPIRLSAPDITDAEIQEVLSVLRTPTLSLGPKLKEFEGAIARYVGVRHAIAVNSGTSGLHLCVEALGIRPGDEVITTPFSFIASSNCILYQGARPVFVDICEDTLNIDPDLIAKNVSPKTKAIIGVDVFGLPANWDRIQEIAQLHGLGLIEDSCEAIGAKFMGRKTGTLAHCGVFAFYPNKQITTGEGGMVVTDSDEIAQVCRSLRNQGRGPGNEWLAHAQIGYNYRLSDINCALGLAQIRRIEEILAKRDAVSRMYKEHLSGIDGIRVPDEFPGITRSWFVYVVRLSKDYSREDRNMIIQGLRAQGIECNMYFPPIHLQPMYVERFGYKPGDFPVTESVSARTIAIPFFNNLDEKSIERVVSALKQEMAQIRRTWQLGEAKAA